MKKENNKKIALIYIIVFVCILSFVFIISSIQNNKINKIDNYIYSSIIILKSDITTNIFKSITFLCSVSFILVLVLFLFLVIKNKNYPIILSLNLIGIVVINNITKYIFLRERPVGISLIEETGYSLPSGHSMTSLAFYGYVIYLIYKNINNKWIKWTSIFTLSINIIFIGISRIYLGVHFASDVIAGQLLALIYLILFIHFIKIKQDKEL